jgi:hypothetical protein
LVPALGFDYAPGDCIARLAASGHEPLEELVLAYAVQGIGMSRGTMRSALEAAKGWDVILRRRPVPPRAVRGIPGELRFPRADRPPANVPLPLR